MAHTWNNANNQTCGFEFLYVPSEQNNATELIVTPLLVWLRTKKPLLIMQYSKFYVYAMYKGFPCFKLLHTCGSILYRVYWYTALICSTREKSKFNECNSIQMMSLKKKHSTRSFRIQILAGTNNVLKKILLLSLVFLSYRALALIRVCENNALIVA